MPIKPEHRALYPKNWKAIRAAVLDRAGHKCEHCGRENGELVLVIADPEDGWWLDPMTGEAFDEQGDSLGRIRGSDWPKGRFTNTVLTIAHLDHDPTHNDGMDTGGPALPVEDANLRALCQRCHLAHDHQHHIANAAGTRRRRLAVRDLFADFADV